MKTHEDSFTIEMGDEMFFLFFAKQLCYLKYTGRVHHY